MTLGMSVAIDANGIERVAVVASEEVMHQARVLPHAEVLEVAGRLSELPLLLQTLAVDAVEEREVDGQEMPPAEGLGPVRLELVEPVELQVGGDETAVEAQRDGGGERVEPDGVGENAAKAPSAPRAWDDGAGGERIEPDGERVVEVAGHGAPSLGVAYASSHRIPLRPLRIQPVAIESQYPAVSLS
jgi:hypothetical protein